MSYIGHTHGCGSSEGSAATNKFIIEEKSTDFSAEKFKFYSIDTINNVVNVTLPTGSSIQNGEWIGFIDKSGTFANYNLIIKYNGFDKIRNNTGDLVVDLNYINFRLVFNNGNWNVFDMSITSVTGSGGSGGGTSDSRYNLVNVNSNFTADVLKLYAVNTTSNVVTATIPTTVQNGDWIDFIDNAGKFGTNKLIIAYNGTHSIRGNNDNLEVDLNFVNFRLIFNNGNWSVIDMSMSVIIAGDGGSVINPSLTVNQLNQALEYVESNIDFINNLTLNTTQLNQVLNYTQENDKYIISEVTGTINTVKSNYYLVNTSSGIATINLPSSPTVGDWIIISDKNKTFATNNATVIFVSPRAIGGNADNFVLDVNGAKVKLVYCTNNWDVLSL